MCKSSSEPGTRAFLILLRKETQVFSLTGTGVGDLHNDIGERFVKVVVIAGNETHLHLHVASYLLPFALCILALLQDLATKQGWGALLANKPG